MGSDYRALSSTNLWALAEWAASRGDAQRLQLIGAAIRENRDSTKTRRDSLLGRIVDAHTALVEGDTAVAVQRLSALVPNATHAELEWQPWEALAAERMTLARLAYAQGRYRDAIRLAAEIDNPYPIAHLMYLRSSLELRAAAADAMDDLRGGGVYRLRLVQLEADSVRVP